MAGVATLLDFAVLFPMESQFSRRTPLVTVGPDCLNAQTALCVLLCGVDACVYFRFLRSPCACNGNCLDLCV